MENLTLLSSGFFQKNSLKILFYMTMEVIQFDLPKLFEMKVFPGKLFTASHSIPLWTEFNFFWEK